MRRMVLKNNFSILFALQGLLMIATVSCETSENDENILVEETNQIANDSVALLKEKVYFEGDTSAYESLATHYMINNAKGDFLFWSLLMANKYNYANAHLDVYYQFMGTCERYEMKDSIKLDSVTDSILTYHLKQSVKLGNKTAEKELMKHP